MRQLGGIFSNQFTSGGLVLMFLGGAMALLREVPRQIYNWAKDQFVVRLTIRDSDAIWEWITLWLDAQPYTKTSRRLAVSSLRDPHEEDTESSVALARVMFSPAVGNHFFRYKGRLVWLSRDRNEPPKEGGRTSESLTIAVLGRSQSAIRSVIDDARSAMLNYHHNRVSVYSSSNGWWRKITGCRMRPYASVYLPQGKADELLCDVKIFLANRMEYESCSVPYHRGYLLSGIPGTGKTSLVTALASELNLNLYVINLSGNGMNDEQLASLMSTVRAGSIVLFEDIDAAFVTREQKTESNTSGAQGTRTPSDPDAGDVTLSGLLNCLDGINAREGCLVFMTTNHIDRLDPALIRNGRIDYRLEFGYADDTQIRNAYARFFPEGDSEDGFGTQYAGRQVTMAEVQEDLMSMRFGRANREVLR